MSESSTNLSQTHESLILSAAPLLHGTPLTYSIILALLPNPQTLKPGKDIPEPMRAYLVGYEKLVTTADPEGVLLREGRGEDAEEAIQGLWSIVTVDAGQVMKAKRCSGKFRRGEMVVEDVGGWKWKPK
jgi:hypothetical protein